MQLPSGWGNHDYTKALKSPDGKSWRHYLSYASTYQRIVEEPGTETREVEVVVGRGESKVVFAFHGKGLIRAIVLRVPKDYWSILQWEMTWDHAEAPQVQAPMDRMYNSWRVGDEAMVGYQLGAFEQDGTVHAFNFYPMPFLEKALGRIINYGNHTATIHAKIIYTLSTEPLQPGTFGYYHVKRVVKDWGPCFNDLLTLENQTGHVVAISWYYPGTFGSWMENDPAFYIDDARTPSMWYSGLEDQIGGANGFRWNSKHPGPFFGWDRDGVPNKRKEEYSTSAYRVGFSDNYYFMRNCRYGIEGHHRAGKRDLDYTFHWYAAAWPSLLLSDEVDMNNDTSVAHHKYHSNPPTSFVSLTSGINGQWYYYIENKGYNYCPEHEKALVTKRGTVMASGGVVTFQANIRADNGGIILWRLVDLFYTPQRARVYIDNRFVGVWMCSDHVPEYAAQRFADNTDFLVPPRLTKGKTSVRISLQVEKRVEAEGRGRRTDYQHIKGFAWTAFHYWIYSIIPDAGKEETTGIY